MILGDEPTAVAIIDDHDVVHAGIEAWCAEADPGIRVAGSFFTSDDYLDVSPSVDVVILDLQFGGTKPDFDTLRRFCAGGQKVIVYSHLTADEVILTSLDIGAATYLVKSEGQRHLIDAIYAARNSSPYVGPRMGRALLNDSTLGRVKLSDREREVLVAWFQTESKELVGKRLYIAPTTVRTHLQRARAKYSLVGRPAPTKSALLARAIEDGILGPDDL
ncbi:DNA-binding response regulator [Mycolicibacterium diernhoferi]|uniref:DNA-binding response regulator n=1 Tax=Mycolicibacterium diernhoferi TaxID=1801 RepID=A0A1Q4H9Q9_9MYCO|nr:response regulator transcription factor [Mycolicibacterium diernhoferi]OJZ64185.1 LuxR family transcriptional regulator [Mycolicibacterium diernhoferi]OPE56088.1 LuxR family transcriptional regulator [Mycolicibacterium diernhoferi]PEG55210.1 DNA-binding response regulator [Mycolicibacterium diernhoferi]QYL21769.1 response regulator transcription factor [Mycolicibacterium diernhoferi]